MNEKNLKMILKKEDLSILIARIDHVGDTLLYTPALSALRMKYPDANITVLSSPLTHEVLRGNTDIDEIICYNEASGEFYDNIRSRKFDVILNFSAAVKDFIEAYKYGGRFRIAPLYKNMLVSQVVGRILLHRAIICEDDPGAYMNNPDSTTLLHEVEQNGKVVSHLYADPVDTSLVLPVFPEDESFADDFIHNKIKIPGDGKIIALQISDRWFYEGYREEGQANLIRELNSKFPDCTILCLSYPGVESIANKVMKSIAECFNCKIDEKKEEIKITGSDKTALFSFTSISASSNLKICFASNIPMKKYTSILKRCEMLVTMHSGATHISAAAGLPSVVVFNHDYFEYFSYRERPWKVEFRAVKKKHNDNDFHELQDKGKKRSVEGNIEDIINACKVLL
ncbi:MAG: hypothetical protein K8T10_08765 [Candidatus Eremiobacteraeota bacterium]|nr:hypothetical protein [Candidatus Eremiobacteraeota bacterium]